MKKTVSLILCLILVLSLFCGCGASSMKTEAAAPAEPAAPMAPEIEMDYGYYYGNAADTAMPEAPAEPAAPVSGSYASGTDLPKSEEGSSLPANTKLIYTASMELETTAFDEAIAGLEALVKDMGGYFEHSNVNNYGTYRQGSYTVRVPAANFDGFCNAVGQLCQLNSVSRSAQDVSEAYYDTESRLVTQKTKLERLQNLLAQAVTMEDIIELENAISNTEYQIEQLTGTLRKYDSLVGYSTVSLYINEVFELTEVEEPVIGFGAKLKEAFQRGSSNFTDGLQRAMIRIARHWVGWLIWIIILVVLPLIIIPAIIRRRRARRNPPAPKAENKAEDKNE